MTIITHGHTGYVPGLKGFPLVFPRTRVPFLDDQRKEDSAGGLDSVPFRDEGSALTVYREKRLLLHYLIDGHFAPAKSTVIHQIGEQTIL